jgi:2-amino-4-hydroxy-6-hydroxymethyldihydropteridine diphosphokinase
MEEKSVEVTLSLGSNLGDKEQNITKAIALIDEKIGRVVCVSDYYYSEPWGYSSLNSFVNCCCIVKSDLNVNDILVHTQAIELTIGRKEKKKNGYEDRLIDIDIIFYGDQLVDSDKLSIPHKNFRKRDFVLLPMNQLSNKIDPETFITINQFTK